MQLIVYSTALFAAMATLILSIYSLRAPNWIRFDTPTSSPFQYSSTYGLRQKCDRSNLHPDFQCRPFPERERDCVGSNKDLIRVESDWWKKFESRINNGNQSVTGHDHHHHHQNLVPVGSGLVEVADIEEEAPPDDGFGFCEKFNTAAYAAEFSVIIGVISMFCVFIVILGNDHRKRHGWKVCCGLIGTHGLLQIIAWALILNVFNNDNRFYFGSKLSTSSYISIASSVIDIVAFTGLFVAGFTLNDDEDSNDEYQPISG
ncbi:hypothetical protein CROQUDRAFT_720409 [Cronartium quercuum f. sp. fusiforme G11]|uniref:Uncharacterized protein n=1 Tax=Cronartium quercuum f. sp. fusiforme G11 TaxID=708437 RepID=A0A9P6NU56_9BASI|nr:hypothetical protein CROQUDRAFT_720409 [Cronartium quercuum f. sp. fusiforme G11]